MKNKRLYNIWSCMKQRCNNPKHTAARWYHDKGIRVCEGWLDFDCFQEWALNNGYREDLTIDRIDSDKNYCPENCRWISFSENAKTVKRSNNRGNKIPRYRVWECYRWFPNKGKKIRVVGEYPYKKDAREAAESELKKTREKAIENAIKNGQEQQILERIKKRDSWIEYMYNIVKI